MLTRARRSLLTFGVLLGLWAAPGAAVAASSPCANVSQSALAQYCEDLPAATGVAPQGADAVVPPRVLARSLPPRIVHQLSARSGAVPQRLRRRLLALPAPSRPVRVGARGPLIAAATPASAGLPGMLLLILVVIALGGCGTACLGRRRRRTG